MLILLAIVLMVVSLPIALVILALAPRSPVSPPAARRPRRGLADCRVECPAPQFHQTCLSESSTLPGG